MNSTIHLGVLNPDEDLVKRINATGVLSTDGDSFLVWGEGPTSDNTLHVLVHGIDLVTRQWNAPETKATIESARRMLQGVLNYESRLFDYVVVSDFEDWSEDHSTWTPTEGDTSVKGVLLTI